MESAYSCQSAPHIYAEGPHKDATIFLIKNALAHAANAAKSSMSCIFFEVTVFLAIESLEFLNKPVNNPVRR